MKLVPTSSPGGAGAVSLAALEVVKSLPVSSALPFGAGAPQANAADARAIKPTISTNRDMTETSLGGRESGGNLDGDVRAPEPRPG
jgi:hypothetical protein